jgi:hypothetical protein
MDGQYFWDTRLPHIITDVTSVTLAATNKALYPVANIPAMGKDYWTPGKAVRLDIWGRMTSGATPGNLTLALLYGTGADANGTSLAASAATAWTANQSNMTWRALLDIHCTAIGTSGALFATGIFRVNEAAIAAELLLPATSPATVTVDLTVANNVLSLQALRSGSTAETMQVHKIRVVPMN